MTTSFPVAKLSEFIMDYATLDAKSYDFALFMGVSVFTLILAAFSLYIALSQRLSAFIIGGTQCIFCEFWL